MDDNITVENVVQQTYDYDKFSFLDANRDWNRGHVEELKKSFAEIGNLTEVQPILVNENFGIIDGQHAFQVCVEMELPIFYTVRNGLTAQDARRINLLHRPWRILDFAKSYATTGKRQYQEYLKLREDYPFSHSVILVYSQMDENKTKAIYKDFRNGDYVLDNLDKIKANLDKLRQVAEIVPISKVSALAFKHVIDTVAYNHVRMLRKLENNSGNWKKMQDTSEALRQFEDIYNDRAVEGNRLRFF